jgi:YidC/Oxa1 family membrane protein insertase
MSPAQQKLMQYLPVAFAVFQVFFLLGLVVYYVVQTVLRIAQQYYITKRFYSGDESLGRQAQAASARARELAQADGGNGQSAAAKRDQADARKGGKNDKPAAPAGPAPTKRTTPPKNRPTSTARQPVNRPGGSRSGPKKRNG